MLNFNDFLAEKIRDLQLTHLNLKARTNPNEEFQEFVLDERPGRKKYSLFELTDFYTLYNYLADKKKKSPIIQIPHNIYDSGLGRTKWT